MAQYRTITAFPPAAAGDTYHRALALLHTDGAIVYRLSNGSVIESRDTWPEGTQGLSETPADPAGQGWTRLTPS